MTNINTMQSTGTPVAAGNQMTQEYFIYPELNPIIFSIGPISLRWYGLMYLIGIGLAYFLAKRRLSRTPWSEEQLSDLIFYSFIGIIVGGRVGNVLFYDFAHFAQDPLYLFRIWEGGMSFHGGALGVMAALWIFAKKTNTHFRFVGDFYVPLVPLGLGAGRIGNFINGELYGRVTDVPWAMIFPRVDQLPRHPSQIYEFLLEGLLLFAIIWIYSRKSRPLGATSGLFLLCYGVLRFLVEYVREPESQVRDLYAEVLTQGQMLCIPMMIVGSALIYIGYKRHPQKAAS